jgi:hypothetical protein
MEKRRILLKTLLLSPLFSGFSFDIFSEILPDKYKKTAEKLALKVQNYPELDHVTRQKLIAKIAFYEELLDRAEVPLHFRLPLDLVSLRRKPREVRLIPSHKEVCFLPDVDVLYWTVLDFWERYKIEKDKNPAFVKRVPSQETVLAILCKESWFIHDVIGDNGKSVGMCQLYFPAAKALLSVPKYHKIFHTQFEIYTKENGKEAHRFKGESLEEVKHNMISFVFDLLQKAHNFSSEYPVKAIRKYNGGSLKYAKSVIRKIIRYKIFIAQCAGIAFDYMTLENSLRHLYFCNNDFSEEFGFNDEEQMKIFRAEARAIFRESLLQEGKTEKLIEQHFTEQEKTEKVTFDDNMPVFFIFKSRERTLYSYFKEELFEAITFHNKHASGTEKISLYEVRLENGRKVKEKILSESQFLKALHGNHALISDVRDGGKIYINPQKGVFLRKDNKDDYVINLVLRDEESGKQ